jgi:hypothetical protein
MSKSYPMIAPVATVRPMPLPCEFALADYRAQDGSTGVVLQFATAAGVQLYFVSQEAAMQLAEDIRGRCTGIVLARPDGSVAS